MPDIRWRVPVEATRSHDVLRSYPGRPLGLRISGSRRRGNGSGGVGWSRSTVRSSKGDCNRTAVRGGKATTESEAMGQLELFPESADSPRGAVAGMDVGRPASAPRAVPVSGNTQRPTPPAMTMEEVANVDNLRRAFWCVERNDGAPGADRQSIAQVKTHLSEILPALSRQLVEERYRPGLIRRVWIPKPDGGQRGLGIPTVASYCTSVRRMLGCVAMLNSARVAHPRL